MFKGSINIVSGIIAFVLILLVLGAYVFGLSQEVILIIFIVGLIVACSPRIVLEWERGVLLRLGKFNRVLKPGISWIVPGIEIISSIVDLRVQTTFFSTEKTLTKDTVPVDVDAVLFWVVFDAEKSILEVRHYEKTIDWLAQTTLRDIIGRSELAKLISDREGLEREMQTIVDATTTEWGITIKSVEIRDVNIPETLEDAMSRRAQAAREKEARIILSESEQEVAKQMKQAAAIYEEDAISLQLRMMNMTYEAVKERGALMVIPSNMAESLSGQTLGIAAAGFKFEDKKAQQG